MVEEHICPNCDHKPFKNGAGLSGHMRISHGESSTGITKTEPAKVTKITQSGAPTEPIELASRKSLSMSGKTLALAEIFINAGFARSPDDLFEKLLTANNSIAQSFGGNFKMQDEKKKDMADVVKDDIMEVQRAKAMTDIFKGFGGSSEDVPKTKNEFLNFMKEQLELKAMTKAFGEGSDFNMKDMMPFLMMQNMMPKQEQSQDPQMQLLIQQLQSQQSQQNQNQNQQTPNQQVMQLQADLKLQQDRFDRQRDQETLMNTLKESLGKKDVDPTEVLKLVTDKMEAVEKQKGKTQEERDLRREEQVKHLEENFKRDIQTSMKGSGIGDAIAQKVETQIIDSLDFNKIINKEEDAWEKAAKVIQPTLDKVADIVINEQQKKMQQEAYKQGLPVHTPEDNALQEQPQPDVPEQSALYDSDPNVQQESKLPPTQKVSESKSQIPIGKPEQQVASTGGFSLNLSPNANKTQFYNKSKTSFFPEKSQK